MWRFKPPGCQETWNVNIISPKCSKYIVSWGFSPPSTPLRRSSGCPNTFFLILEDDGSISQFGVPSWMLGVHTADCIPQFVQDRLSPAKRWLEHAQCLRDKCRVSYRILICTYVYIEYTFTLIYTCTDIYIYIHVPIPKRLAHCEQNLGGTT